MLLPYVKTLFVLLALSILTGQAMAFDQDGPPIFDAHIHYNHDVWDAISPEDAVRRLREVGIQRAMVSSSSDEGTQRLYAVAPDLVIPVLSPYRKRGLTRSWMHDETVIPYIKERLAKYRYLAIGEFHLEGAEADLPVVRAVLQLAKQYKLMLHVHGDADSVERIFKYAPAAQIIWAHAGFEYGDVVRSMLERHDKLWADLSFRTEIYSNDRFFPGWRELLIEHSDRFMLSTDTYTPQRWLDLPSIMHWQNRLLNALPEDVANSIAWENGERVIISRFD